MAEATYFYGVASSAAAQNKRHLAVFNPSGSGKTLKLYWLKAAPFPAAPATGLQVGLVAVRITSAPTGGTDAVACEAVVAGADPTGIVAKLGATGGATEPAVSPFGAGAVSGEETVGASGDTLYEAPLDGSTPMTFAPGEGFLVKQGALASAGNISVVAKVTFA